MKAYTSTINDLETESTSINREKSRDRKMSGYDEDSVLVSGWSTNTAANAKYCDVRLPYVYWYYVLYTNYEHIVLYVLY